MARFGVFESLGPLIICEDFNAKYGDLDTNSEGLYHGVRNIYIIDVVKNSQGEAFVDFLRAPI